MWVAAAASMVGGIGTRLLAGSGTDNADRGVIDLSEQEPTHQRVGVASEEDLGGRRL